MAEKQEKKKKKSEPEADEGVLVSAAKAIGAAAGKVAALAGAVPSPPKVKIPKLQPKNKTRLPRRQKKALQKAAARKG
jgi:hypothetical protein